MSLFAIKRQFIEIHVQCTPTMELHVLCKVEASTPTYMYVKHENIMRSPLCLSPFGLLSATIVAAVARLVLCLIIWWELKARKLQHGLHKTIRHALRGDQGGLQSQSSHLRAPGSAV